MRAAHKLSEHRLFKAMLAGFLLAPLAACGTSDRMRPGSSIAAEDYRVTHPIILTKEATSIDIFPSSAQGGFDRHSAKQVAAFAQEYRDNGRGPVTILLPSDGSSHDQHVAVADIKRVFATTGAHATFDVSVYPIGNPSLASPVRLSFHGLKAKVADQCGQWPSDLASGSTVDEWNNRPYYNFGCATQSMIAAQTADPRDLVTPRGEEPADTLVRERAIDSIRKGTDPSTNWNTKNTSISSVGSN